MIDYQLLSDAAIYYYGMGFEEATVPWIVSKDAMDITAEQWGPRQIYPIGNDGYLVASGEQSFFQMILDKKLEPGRWQCTTPCFRDDTLDELHHRYFMKVELINTNNPDTGELEFVIDGCLSFFNQFIDCHAVKLPPPTALDLSNTSFDIVTNKNRIEIGSYGIREHPKLGRWLYATGCAEPRFSYVVEKEKSV